MNAPASIKSAAAGAVFATHQDAAKALVASAALSSKEGGFVGQMAFSDDMSEKQERWLRILLGRHDLPPLAGGDHG